MIGETGYRDRVLGQYPGEPGPSPWIAKKLHYVVSRIDFEAWHKNNIQATTKKNILEGLNAIWMEPISLDEPSFSDERSYRGTKLSPDGAHIYSRALIDHEQQDMLDAVEINAVVHALLADLREFDSRLCDIVVLRYGFYDGTTWTLQAIADQFDLTRERVRQLEIKALELIGSIVLEKTLIHQIAQQGGARRPAPPSHRPVYRAGVSPATRPSDLDLRTRFPADLIPKTLGIQQRTFHSWIQFSSFPRPTRIEGSDYWLLSDVVTWAINHDRIRFR